ncbi:MAG: DUF3362 domain-containing protein, partial [Rhodobacteraceae bacterium]|nr:DUF3362 domain-containing protein [Paracoccaceae bacterium]
LDQVQTFLPTPMAMATTMYHTEKNPLKKIERVAGETVGTVRNARQRKLHKAFLRYHDAENWPLLRDALKEMGRADLIGNGKKHLVPAWQPAGTGLKAGYSENRATPAGRGRPVAAKPTARGPRPAGDRARRQSR